MFIKYADAHIHGAEEENGLQVGNSWVKATPNEVYAYVTMYEWCKWPESVCSVDIVGSFGESDILQFSRIFLFLMR